MAYSKNKIGYSKVGQPIEAGSQRTSGPKGAPKSSPKKVVSYGSMGKMKMGKSKMK